MIIVGQLKASVRYKKGGKSVDKLTFANTYKAEGTKKEIEGREDQSMEKRHQEASSTLR